MTENSKVKVGGILLAAGGSRRLGTPKQLLLFEGKTLLRRAAEALTGSGCEPVVVVLGGEIERSRDEIPDLPITIVENPDWESGMSSSIRAGLMNLLEIEPELDAVMITLCDQPRVTAEHLKIFTEKFNANGNKIIAAEYNGVRGVPALFAREMFDYLQNLTGDKGARDLVKSRSDVDSIDLPEAAYDIDIPHDMDGLRA